MKYIYLSLVVAVSISLSCDQNKAKSPITLPNGSISEKLEFIKDPSNFNSESERLNFLFEVYNDFHLASSPIMATYFGKATYDHMWDDFSPTGFEDKNKSLSLFKESIQWIKKESLNKDQELSLQILESIISSELQRNKYPEHFIRLNQKLSVHHYVVDMLNKMPTNNLNDLNNIYARLNAIPEYFENVIKSLEEGIDKNITVPRTTVIDVPEQLMKLVVDDMENSPFYTSIGSLDSNKFHGVDLDSIQREFQQTIVNKVNPSIDSFREFVVEQYLPNTRETVGLGDLPNGNNWYNERIRFYTSSSNKLTAEDIHQIGLNEVARIENEMVKILEETGFDGDLHAFDYFLKNDPQFIFETKGELITGFRSISKLLDPETPKLFGQLPRLPYGVKMVPEYIEKNAPGAYYIAGSLESGVSAFFYVNAHDLKNHPKWSLEALIAHEAVPGHHLQLALAQELEEVPEFRKSLLLSSFSEGWGLYAESLGYEIGLYKTPYTRYGRLTLDMVRAIRLVVDTGIHSKRWTRQEAIDYIKRYSKSTDSKIAAQVDRYIALPGQALSYKIGELKIKELRSRAEEELKNQFDIREFHDVVLGNGTIPLDVLEVVVNEWIEEKLQIG